MPDSSTRTSASSALCGCSMSRIFSRFFSTRRASIGGSLKRLTPRVSVLRRQLDNLLRSHNRDRQAPLELFVSRKHRMQPPTARRERDRSLSVLIESHADWRTTLHPFLQKVFKPLARAWLGEKLVTHRNDVDRKIGRASCRERVLVSVGGCSAAAR